MGHRRALVKALASVRRHPEVDTVALVVYGVPEADKADLGVETCTEAIDRLVSEFDDIDVVITGGIEVRSFFSTIDAVDVAWRRDWAGGRTALVMTDALLHGAALAKLTVHGGGPGGLTNVDASLLELDCDAAEDPAARKRLDDLHDVVVERLGTVTGLTTAPISGEDFLAGEPCVCRGQSTAETRACGCWVSECAANDLAADALAWYASSMDHPVDLAFHNAGAIRDNLPAGPIRKEDILKMLPFLDEVVVADVDGATLRAIFERSLSIYDGSWSWSSRHPTDGRFLAYRERRRNLRLGERRARFV